MKEEKCKKNKRHIWSKWWKVRTDNHFYRQSIKDLLLGIKESMGKGKEYPPNIKREIWGGEGGLPPTKIESSDVFGIKFVDGFNQAKAEDREIIDRILKEICE